MTDLEKELWKKDVAEYHERNTALIENKNTMFSIVWGQCLASMQTKLISLSDFKELKLRHDVVGLLKHIKAIAYQFDTSINSYEAVHDAKKRFYTIQQWDEESVMAYFERFKGMYEMLKSYGVNACEDECLINHEASLTWLDVNKKDTWNDFQWKAYEICKATAESKATAMAFIKGGCKRRFRTLQKNLRNRYTHGHDEYPEDLVSACNLLTHYRKEHAEQRGRNNNRHVPKGDHDKDDGPDMTFAQMDANGKPLVAGKDGKVLSHIDCRGCGRYGHRQNQCPKNEANDRSMAENGSNVNLLNVGDGHSQGGNFCFLNIDVAIDTDMRSQSDASLDTHSSMPSLHDRDDSDSEDESVHAPDDDEYDSDDDLIPPLYDRSDEYDSDDDEDYVSNILSAARDIDPNHDHLDDSSDNEPWDTAATDQIPYHTWTDASDEPVHLANYGPVEVVNDNDINVEKELRMRRSREIFHNEMRALDAYSDVLTSSSGAELDALHAAIIRNDQSRMEYLGLHSNTPSIHGRLGTSFSQTAVDLSFLNVEQVHLGRSMYLQRHPYGLSHGPMSHFRARRAGHGYTSDDTASTADSTRTERSASDIDPEIDIESVSLSQDMPPIDNLALDFTFLKLGDPNNASKRITGIDPNWVLLDSELTVSIFCNANLLSNIRPATTPHRIYGNGGYTEVRMVGDIKNFGTVWFHPGSLANTLSLAAVRKKFRVTMDSAAEAAFVVHRQNGQNMYFRESARGLYYFDSADSANDTTTANSINSDVSNYSLINTVSQNESEFSPRQVEGAKRARELYKRIGHPSYARFLEILRKNEIINCPVTVEDAQRAEYIYGPDVAALKGKTVRRPMTHVQSFFPIPLPDSILKHHGQVTICADVFFVQNIKILHTISRNIQLRTVENIPSLSETHLLQGIDRVINLYKGRGFQVTSLHADNDFKPLEHKIRPTRLNICAANEHVGEIERSIRTMKNAIRSTIQGLPFKRYPKQMIISLVKWTAMNLNSFVAPNGVSDTLSPRSIVNGEPKIDYNVSCKLAYGTYVQTHEEPDPSNRMEERTTGAIALHPTGNIQGGYYFLSLNTWRVLNRRSWTELPMPRMVVDAVNKRGEQEKQPLIKNGEILFEWTPGNPIEDGKDDEDEDDDPESDSDDESESSSSDEDDEDDESDEPDNDGEIEPNEDEYENDAVENTIFDENKEGAEQLREAIGYNENELDDILDDDEDDDEREDDESIDDPMTFKEERSVTSEENRSASLAEERSAQMNEDERIAQNEEGDSNDGIVSTTNENENGVRFTDEVDVIPDASEAENVHGRAHGYNLRQNRTRSYKHIDPNMGYSFLGVGKPTVDIHKEQMRMADVLFTQMTAHKGIRKHGQIAINAMIKEYAQLDEQNVFKPLDASTLTSEQKKKALGAVDLIKEKRCGRIKGRTCANSKPQRQYIPKEDATAPAISLEALLMTLVIDAKEGRDVATADVSGAFLRGFNEDFDVLKMRGEMVDYLVAANKERYELYVSYENGRKVIYLQLVKAMYGLLKAAIIWWRMFSGRLSKMGFKLNPYDKCVANKMINGKQCTIGWYVDNVKISHEDPKVVDAIIADT